MRRARSSYITRVGSARPFVAGTQSIPGSFREDDMHRVERSTSVVLLAIVAAVLLAIAQTMTSVVALAATALIMGGTQHPLSVPPDTQTFVNSYVAAENNTFIAPSGLCTGGSPGCTLIAVVTPEEFFPVFGTLTFNQSVAVGQASLDRCLHADACTITRVPPPASNTGTTTTTLPKDPFVVLGYSSSATIATLEKRKLAAEATPPETSFILVANPNRPNGGFLERFNFNNPTIPILDVTFSGATPTNTNFTTVDVARQYDGWTDWPLNPLNLLADANAIAGILYLHSNYTGTDLPEPVLQGQYQDTTYYLRQTARLPILIPLQQLGIPDPILAVMDAPLRVLVEAGYNRTTNPGQPTTANFFYFPNPIVTAGNLVTAIPTGLDDGAQEAFGIRPFGTTPAGPYGVGGPPVNAGSVDPFGPPTPALTTTATTTALTNNQAPANALASTATTAPQQTSTEPVRSSTTNPSAQSETNPFAGSTTYRSGGSTTNPSGASTTKDTHSSATSKESETVGSSTSTPTAKRSGGRTEGGPVGSDLPNLTKPTRSVLKSAFNKSVTTATADAATTKPASQTAAVRDGATTAGPASTASSSAGSSSAGSSSGPGSASGEADGS